MADLDVLDKTINDFSKSVDEINKVGDLVKTVGSASIQLNDIINKIADSNTLLERAVSELKKVALDLKEEQENNKVTITEKILDIKKAISTYNEEIIDLIKEQTKMINSLLEGNKDKIKELLSNKFEGLNSLVLEQNKKLEKQKKNTRLILIIQSGFLLAILILDILIVIT